MTDLPRCIRLPHGHRAPKGYRHIETLITYKRKPISHGIAFGSYTLRPGVGADLKHVFRIIRLTTWHSRLFTDPEVYNEWAYAFKERYVRGNLEGLHVVTYPSGKSHGLTTYIVGFMVVESHQVGQEVGLIGVDPAWKRKGVGSLLLNSLAGDVIMKTQASNVDCQAFLASLGFVEVMREDTYHAKSSKEDVT